ncbi:type VI secretion system tube protein Hcp [Robbsia sp. KACC 23696]|uniref:Hcp family type VI secretion system effector n=1 Tax=Robbsia sp. KACC 23696 TaxID=3149231 RepID=UPI00325B9EB5
MDTLVLSIDSIAGNATLTGYAGKIIIEQFSLSVSLPMNMDVANTERTMGRPSFSEISVTKMTDISTPPLYAACTAGTKLGNITLTVMRNEGGVAMEYSKYVMTNAMISNISTSGGSNGSMDSLSINYTKITTEFTQQSTDSTKKGTAQFGWDLTTNVAAS